MHLESLDVSHAPGMPRGFRLTGLPPGLVMLLGPNASGKSTTGRVLGYLLWPDEAGSHHAARAAWRLSSGGPVLTAALQYGRTEWSQTDALPRSELFSTWNLTLKDLLQEGNPSDDVIAGAINRELNGGYDLTGLDPGQPVLRPPWQVKRPLRDASATLDELTAALVELADDEARLPKLQQRASDAGNAPKRLGQVEKALELAEIVRQLEAIRTQLDSLPDHLASVPDDAAATAQDLESKVEEWTQELANRDANLNHTAQEVAKLAFPSGAPPPEIVDDWMLRADALVQDEQVAKQCQQQQHRRTQEVSELANQIWSEPGPNALPDRAMLESFSAAVEDVNGLRAQLASIPSSDPSATEPLPPNERNTLNEARQRLRDWLSTPRSVVVTAEPQRRTGLSLACGVAGLALMALGIAVGLLASPLLGSAICAFGTLLFGVAAGLWFGHAGSRAGAPPDTALADLQARYAAAGHPPPEAWTVTEVSVALDKLERAIHDDEMAKAERIRTDNHTQRRDQLQHDLAASERKLQATLDTLGLSQDLPALALSIQVNRIVALADARANLADEEAAAERSQATLDANLADLRAEVEALGLTELPALDAPGSLRSAVVAIAKQRTAWAHLCEQHTTAEKEQQKSSDQLSAAREALGKHLSRCGVEADDAEGLAAVEAQRKVWVELSDEHRVLTKQQAGLVRDVPAELQRPDLDLEAEKSRLTELAEEVEGTQAEVAAIQQRIEDRTRGRSVQDALSQKAQALEKLAEHRDEQRQRAVLHGLIGWMRAEGHSEDAPELLKRAREWFLTFTRNRYLLEMGADGEFQALDQTLTQRQKLSELSDGTRVQLLLAARLAFIEHTERGGTPVPLFLDEALSTTDPGRFREIAQAVMTLAKTRQVFYATSNPTEVALWEAVADNEGFQPPHVARLGAAMTDAGWNPLPTLPIDLARVPEPGDRDALQYVQALGLPRPDLHTHAQSWPLALVLYDALPVVHAAASKGLKHVGQLSLVEQGVPLPMDADTLALAQARAQVLEATLEALREGRGRPVPWDAVTASPGFSSTTQYASDIRTHHAALGHDPRAFLAATRGVGRFGSTDKQLQLEQHLQEQGFYDPSDPLDLTEVVHIATVRSRPALDAELLDLAEIDRLVRFTCDVVQVRPGDSSAED